MTAFGTWLSGHKMPDERGILMEIKVKKVETVKATGGLPTI